MHDVTLMMQSDSYFECNLQSGTGLARKNDYTDEGIIINPIFVLFNQ